jgi:hypothetical protein
VTRKIRDIFPPKVTSKFVVLLMHWSVLRVGSNDENGVDYVNVSTTVDNQL